MNVNETFRSSNWCSWSHHLLQALCVCAPIIPRKGEIKSLYFIRQTLWTSLIAQLQQPGKHGWRRNVCCYDVCCRWLSGEGNRDLLYIGTYSTRRPCGVEALTPLSGNNFTREEEEEGERFSGAEWKVMCKITGGCSTRLQGTVEDKGRGQSESSLHPPQERYILTT